MLALALGMIALGLLSLTSQDSEQFGRLNDLLLLVNGAGAAVLLVLIIGNLVRLVRDYRAHAAGARLKARMLGAFVLLAVAPLVVVWIFAVQFLNQGIESWFDVEIEAGLGGALELSRAALDGRMRDSLSETRSMGRKLAGLSAMDTIGVLDELRRQSDALEATVYGDAYRIVANSARDTTARFPVQPPEDLAMQLRRTGEYVGLDTTSVGGLQIRAAVILPPQAPGQETRTLQVLFPVGGRIAELADAVEGSYRRYGELAFLRGPLRYSFTFTLTLVVLLSFLAALYGAFFFTRRLVAPLQSLVAGTRAVARGDLDTRLPIAARDEIGFLIDGFNEMIQRLRQARESARLSAAMVEDERARLAAILARLSTGVIALEANGEVRTANAAASAILNADLSGSEGRRLEDMKNGNTLLSQFVDALGAHLDSGAMDWREQLVLRSDTGRRVLSCACTALPGESGGLAGRVVVFDDVTTLLQAQRDAAWGEVARRLAHEIKNPLTPIQLSAERIRRRYLKGMKEMEAEVLDRATHTIVQQVEAMRDMVNAFSEYARAPELHISAVNLNQLVREVAYLYQARDSQPAMTLSLEPALGEIEADAVRMRQLLHNLIRNALEALEGRDDARLTIKTGLDAPGEFIELRIIDNGPGFDPDSLDQIFEPYVTTKAKGTGLGLAIVKKMVEEHGGKVTAENLPSGGACVTVRLPVRQEPREPALELRGRNIETRRERA